jgi:2-keto-4-pentenoate hydratase/2-oxohepta-3-ene-1,7-dioic acid hydratase in catechol pathway
VKYGTLDGETVHESEGRFSVARLGASWPLSAVRLLPPCSPSKIVCVGRNYKDHAAEFGSEVPPEPLIFLKPPSALIAHGDLTVYPAISQRMDFEGEIGIVIGRRARHASRADAADYVFGYTCVNDITARDLQAKDDQWSRAKGFDTFCAVGPWIVSRDEVRFEDLRVTTWLDGVKKQEAPSTLMIYNPGHIIEYITACMTLEPGDLIATGTPAGVGPMQVGQVVRVTIDGLGTLENTVTR